MKKIYFFLVMLFAVNGVWGQTTIAQWGFEGVTTTNTGTAPIVSVGSAVADAGAQTAGSLFSALHASASTVWSNPAGNGSVKSVSSNNWAVGDYYQFLFNTTCYNSISITWDQTGSSTGPRDFKVQYSTNGSTFTDASGTNSTYSLIVSNWSTVTPHPEHTRTLDLSGVSALNNQATVYIRLVDNSTTSIGGGVVATGGTGRVDNFKANGSFTTTWLGTTSPDWFNPANWSCGLPTLTTDVIIPPGTPNPPAITPGPTALVRNLTVQAGVTNFQMTGNSRLDISGDLSLQGQFLRGSGEIHFGGTGARQISSVIPVESFFDVFFDIPGGTVNFGGAITTVVARNVTVQNGTVNAQLIQTEMLQMDLTGGTFNAGPMTILNGGYNHTGGTFAPGTGELRVKGTGTHTITGTFAVESFFDIFYEIPLAGVVNFGGSITKVTANNVTQQDGTVNAPIETEMVQMVLTGGTYNAGSSTKLSSHWYNNGGTFNPGTGIFELNGGVGSQSIGGTNPTTFYDLKINHTGTGVSAANNLNVNTLTLTTGVVTIGVNNLIVTGSIAGGSSTSFVSTNNSGALTINGIGASNVLFPVGPSFSLYHPVTINNAGTADNFSVKVSSTDPACAVTSYSVNATWDIVEGTPGGSNCTITLDFTGASTGGSYNSANARIIHCNGTTADYNNGSVTGTVATGSGFTSFSPFGVSSDPVALPVKFANVRAYQQGSAIKIDWSNLTESNVANYIVERSANGSSFTALNTIGASRNDGGRADYTSLDVSPLSGVNFYRIHSNEFDGKSLYSVIVKVNTKGGVAGITIYPNPVTGGQVSLQTTGLSKGLYAVRIFNAGGQQVFNQLMNHNGGAATEVIQLPAALKPGMYSLQLSGGEVKLAKSFILR